MAGVGKVGARARFGAVGASTAHLMCKVQHHPHTQAVLYKCGVICDRGEVFVCEVGG